MPARGVHLIEGKSFEPVRLELSNNRSSERPIRQRADTNHSSRKKCKLKATTKPSYSIPRVRAKLDYRKRFLQSILDRSRESII